MIGIGYDPGFAASAVAVIDDSPPARPAILLAQTIRTTPEDDEEIRWRAVWSVLHMACADFRPQVVGVEDQRQAWIGAMKRGETNANGLLPQQAVGLARGVALGWGARVVLVSPQAVKSAVLGQGRGEKAQIKEAIDRLCERRDGPSRKLSEHAADAVAIAIAAARRFRLDQRMASAMGAARR